MPVLLRNHDECFYTWVGECYLHTMMDGQATRMQEELSGVFMAARARDQTLSEREVHEESHITYREFELR